MQGLEPDRGLTASGYCNQSQTALPTLACPCSDLPGSLGDGFHLLCPPPRFLLSHDVAKNITSCDTAVLSSVDRMDVSGSWGLA